MSAIVDEIRREHALAKRWITWIKGEVDLLDSRPSMQRSTILRAPYLDPVHLMQVDLLRRWRAGNRADARAAGSAARERVGHRAGIAGHRLII